jgi:hypothetical protein
VFNWSNPIIYGFLLALGVVLLLILWKALNLPSPF